jgi:hypothetical protein
MQMLTIEAKSPQSALAFLVALSEFHPTLTTDEAGRHLVSIKTGSERHVLEVLDAVRDHFAGRVRGDAVSTMTVGMNDEDRVRNG